MKKKKNPVVYCGYEPSGPLHLGHMVTITKLKDLKFEIISTLGTAKFLEENGIIARTIQRVSDGKPNVLDLMKEGKIKLIINTVSGKMPRQDEQKIRSSAIALGIPVITTLPGAEACARGIEALIKHKLGVKSIQAYHRKLEVSS